MPDLEGLSPAALVELATILIPLLKGIIAPDLTDQINKALFAFREERAKKREALKAAILSMDVPKINALIAELFG